MLISSVPTGRVAGRAKEGFLVMCFERYYPPFANFYKCSFLAGASGQLQSDGKRPDGRSIIPWLSGRLLLWDTTCRDTTCSYTFTPSNLSAAVTEASTVAVQAEILKNVKYIYLDSVYTFVSVAVERVDHLGLKQRLSSGSWEAT